MNKSGIKSPQLQKSQKGACLRMLRNSLAEPGGTTGLSHIPGNIQIPGFPAGKEYSADPWAWAGKAGLKYQSKR
jgi:hypothetical protein